MTLKELSVLVGGRIRERRLITKMTQSQLAEGINKSANYVGLIERGDRIPSLNTLLDLSDILGVPTAFFFTFEKHEPRSERERATRQLNGFMNSRPVEDVEKLLQVAQVLFRHQFKAKAGKKK